LGARLRGRAAAAKDKFTRQGQQIRRAGIATFHDVNRKAGEAGADMTGLFCLQQKPWRGFYTRIFGHQIGVADDAKRLDGKGQLIFEYENRVVLSSRSTASSDNTPANRGLEEFVVRQDEPDFCLAIIVGKTFVAEAVSAGVAVASSQGGDGDLTGRAFDLPTRAECGEAAHAPHQAVRIPFHNRWFRRPTGRMFADGPDRRGSSVGQREQIGPDEIVQRALD